MATGLTNSGNPALRLSILISLVVVLAAACSLILDLGECDSNADCPDNQVCTPENLCSNDLDGVNQYDPGDPCSTDGQCDDDEVCGAHGHCSATCLSDGDCSEGSRCTLNNYCRPAPTSCEEDVQCFEGYLCSVNNRCIDSSAQCEEHQDCVDLFGAGASCDDGVCLGDTALTGGPCERLYGAAGEEDSILIGVILQLTGVGGGFGQPMLDSIRIAARDINSGDGIEGRKIGLIACDTEASNEIAETAAQHLVHTAGVEAIIGLNSSQVLQIAPAVTVPNNVLVMSPSATAQAITYLTDSNLVWRTAPSDEHQAAGLLHLIEYVLGPNFELGTDGDPKLSILVRRQDQWAEGLFDELIAGLPGELVADEQRFSSHTFANVGTGEPADYTDVAAELASESPHSDVVVVLGSADSWQVISHVDNALPTDPLFLGADAMKNLEEAAQASSDLEGRIWGTGPRTAAELDYQPYTIFRLKFEEEMNVNADNFQFVANAFDALYTVAFAAAAAHSLLADCDNDGDCTDGQVCSDNRCVGTDPVTGPNLAIGLGRLAEGAEIRPTATDAQAAITALVMGNTINYAGASGAINFDAHGDPEPMPIALWCFEDGQVPERGVLYSPTTDVFHDITCQPVD